MIRLVRPDPAYHRSWLEMVREFGGAHLDGAAIRPEAVASMADPETFAAWVATKNAEERADTPVPDGWVHSTARWVLDGDEVVGSIHLRHELTDYLLEEGGHIGYSVRPSARRRGIATRALAMVLEECRARGIDPVLLTCDDANVASARVVEANGGVLEDVRGGTRRYWVTLGDKAAHT